MAISRLINELKQIGAKTAWLKIQTIDETACINRLLILIEDIKPPK